MQRMKRTGAIGRGIWGRCGGYTSIWLLRLSKKLTPSIISFLMFVFINPLKSTYNQL
jgi:hypothetical protein